MENRDRNWVDEQLAALQPPQNWTPNPAAGLSRLRAFCREVKHRRRQRLLVTVISAVILLAALLMEAPKAYCAGAGCAAPTHEKPPGSSR